MNLQKLTTRKWFYPLVYFLLVAISLWPPYTQLSYDPRDTQDVILNILMNSTHGYAAWGWIFHVGTLGVIALIIFRPGNAGRPAAIYFGLNYFVIAAVQTSAMTEKYGFALQTGALISSVLLGILWLWVAWKDKLHISFQHVPAWRWALLPLALLVFWSPLRVEGAQVLPDFNPLLLLTSPDYGLSYCFMTPVFLFLLIVAYPDIDDFVFHVTAFNGLIYGLLNLIHWFSPERVWLGVMHLPLLIISIMALAMPRLETYLSSKPAWKAAL